MSKLIAKLSDVGKVVESSESQIRGVKASFSALRVQLTTLASEVEALGKADAAVKMDSGAELQAVILDLTNILALPTFNKY